MSLLFSTREPEEDWPEETTEDTAADVRREATEATWGGGAGCGFWGGGIGMDTIISGLSPFFPLPVSFL